MFQSHTKDVKTTGLNLVWYGYRYLSDSISHRSFLIWTEENKQERYLSKTTIRRKKNVKKKKIYKSPKPKYASKCTFPVPSSSLADSLTCCASLWCAKLRTWPAALYGLQLSPACMCCSWGKQASQTFINISLLLLPCSLLLSLMLSPLLLSQPLHTHPASRNYGWNYICYVTVITKFALNFGFIYLVLNQLK